MNDVCAIIILYNPDEETINYWKFFQNNFKHLFFIDNSNDKIEQIELNNYYSLGQNKGIAYAQNFGIALAKELGFQYIINFDQDSRFDYKIIYDLLKEFKKIKEYDNRIVAMGPAIIEKETGEFYKSSRMKESVRKTDFIISSGSIIPISSFDNIGMYNELLFIDGVDQEWCWRALSEDYNIYISKNVTINHTVGQKKISFFGYPIIFSAPFRYFYKYRNYVWLLSLKYVPLKWKFKTGIRRLIEPFFFLFFIKNSFSAYHALLKGLVNGFLSRKSFLRMSSRH